MKILPSQPQFLPDKGQEVTGLCVMGFGGSGRESSWAPKMKGLSDPLLPHA